jgi:hypothetical protein
MKFFMGIILLFSLSSRAAELYSLPKRESSIGLNVTLAKDYGSVDVSGAVGLNENWRLWLRGNETKSTDLTSKELRIGADVIVEDNFLPRMSLISRQEPGEIQGSGLGGGFDLGIQRIWNGELQTLLSVDLEAIRYFQKLSGSGINRLPPEEVLVQSSLTLGVAQDLGKSWAVALSATGYRYDQDPELWSEAVSNRYWNVRSLDIPVLGFPRNSSLLQVQWSPTLRWNFGVGSTTARGANGTISRGSQVTATYLAGEHFILDLILASSQTEGIKDPGFLGLGTEYLF